MDTVRKGAGLQAPSVGRRGGLGRTLLTMFLVLAVLPLSVVSWYATQRGRLNIQEEVTEKLGSIADLKQTQISRWIEERIRPLTTSQFESDMILIADTVGSETESSEIRAHLRAAAEQWEVSDLALLSANGQVESSSDPTWEGQTLLFDANPHPPTGEMVQASLYPSNGASLVLVTSLDADAPWPFVAARTSASELIRIMEETPGLGETGQVYLVDQSGHALPQGRTLNGPTIDAGTQGEGYQGLYENHEGVPVIGLYRWLPNLEMALFVEQSQEEAFEGNNTVATAVIAATLAVALITAIIAAFVVRQIVQPLVRLTESTLRIASGDLSERVEVTSRDEIGILAHVFNRMAAELEVLYNDLETKVKERTRALQQANYQIQWRAIQMQASLEVGQAVTSILEPDRLLEQVVRVVRDRFVYSYVSVYTVDAESEVLTLRASAGEPQDSTSELPNAVLKTLEESAATVESRPAPITIGPPTSYTYSEVALPLRLGDRTRGVLYVQSTDEEAFDQDDVSVLQNVANQITIALENARAYAIEREAARHLRELNRSKRRFLSNMSHELRTPLTNIIGFSRLMLKGISGPLTDEQRNDLNIIYHNGQHLLGLINDLLDISHIEAGMMELEPREVDLSELIQSVMATAGALVRGKDITLHQEIPSDLPAVQVDPTRIRQVLLRLLANAAKFTQQGAITVQAQPTNGQVVVSVSDTGVGISAQDQKRIFEQFEQGTLEDGRRPDGAGLGLALSREFVEMHGGRIWVESEVGEGSTFTFTLPLEYTPTKRETGASDHG